MIWKVFLRAAAVQAVLVVVLFALLLVLPLPRHFFRDWGIIIGPLAWIVCSLATGRILRLSLARTALASAAGGVAAGLAGMAASHSLSLPVAIAVFAAGCAGHLARRRPDRSNDDFALALNDRVGR